MSALLLNANATVTICHSQTHNLQEITKQADIVVTAIGQPHFFDQSFFNENALVIDVGINRIEKDGVAKLIGDVDYKNTKVKYITPVPGGVGPLTVTNLLANTIKAAKLYG